MTRYRTYRAAYMAKGFSGIDAGHLAHLREVVDWCIEDSMPGSPWTQGRSEGARRNTTWLVRYAKSRLGREQQS